MDPVSLTHLPMAWPHPGSRFRDCTARRTAAIRVVGARTCPSGAVGRSGSSSGTEVCSSCSTNHKRFGQTEAGVSLKHQLMRGISITYFPSSHLTFSHTLFRFTRAHNINQIRLPSPGFGLMPVRICSSAMCCLLNQSAVSVVFKTLNCHT